MGNVFLVVLIGSIAIIGITNYPRRQPDTLAPIQLITLTGVAGLMLLQIAGAVATTYWWIILPTGAVRGFALLYLSSAALSAITTCAVLGRGLLHRRLPPSAELAGCMRAEVEALKPIVCGGHGIGDIRLVRGSAHGAEVEVIRTPEGAGIRAGEGLPNVLARFERHPAGGAHRVRTLIRFMLLHELGHLLNGDHLTYQLARATLLAQLWYLAPLAAFEPLLVAAAARGVSREELAAIVGMDLLLAVTTMTVLFQRVIAARFAAVRERLADWRATVTLTSADRRLLLDAPAGDRPFLEKALTALALRPAASTMATLLTLTWPRPERIDARVEQLSSGGSRGRHEPLRWSALAGVNVGALVVLVISLAAPVASAWGKNTAQNAALAVVLLLAAIPAAILVGRAEPTNPFSDEPASWDRRIQTAGAYALAHAGVVFIGYLALYAAPPLSPLQTTTAGTVIFLVTLVVGAVASLVGIMIELGPAWLRLKGRLAMMILPFFFGGAVIAPMSTLLAQSIGYGLPHPFGVLLLPTFMTFAFGCGAINSKRGLVSRVFPFGSHGAGDVHLFRVLMADIAADMNDVRRLSLFLRLTLLWSTQTALAFTVVAAVALLLRTWISPIDTIGTVFGLSLLSGVVLAVWPKKKKEKKAAVTAQTEQNLDVLHALFQVGCRGPLGPLLERLKAPLAGQLRTMTLRGSAEAPAVVVLRRAAERMELANATGATDVAVRWMADAGDILREHVAGGVVRSWREGPPSAYWTAWAARLASAAWDGPAARALAQSASRLLPTRCNSVQAIFVAATAARLVPGAAPSSLRSPDLRRLLHATDSLSDVAAIVSPAGGDAAMTLRQTVRSRLWTNLHANSRRQLLFLLDLLDAGTQLGEEGTPLWHAANEHVRDLLLDDAEALLGHLDATAA